MTTHMRLLLTIFLSLTLFIGCNPESGSSSSVPAKPSKQLTVPRFDRDSAYAFVEKQVAFGPRVLGSEGHDVCGTWIEDKLKSYGLTVERQNFTAKVYTGESFPAFNIIAQYNPSAQSRILLSAHWDTRHIADSELAKTRQTEPILGADDGGSGVGVLIEIARQLSQNELPIGVDFVFFDAEDYGERTGASDTWALGAQYWSKNLHKPGYMPMYGILLDMVGSRNARFAKEGISMQVASPVVNKVWKLAQDMGYGTYFSNELGGSITDDHLFVIQNARIPMIDIINVSTETPSGFGPHWHTHNDDMGIIDARTLRAVGQVVLAVLFGEANQNI